MRHFSARLEEITLLDQSHPVVRLSCAPKNIPSAGQAVLSYLPGSQQPLRQRFFPTRRFEKGFLTDTLPDPAVPLGAEIDLLGPIGNGFNPPAESLRWLLLSLEESPYRLLPLITQGLDRGAAISLHADRLPSELPPQVELNPNLEEALAWADYLAIELSADALPRLSEEFITGDSEPVSAPAEVLVLAPLPCGFGACQACAVQSAHGWKLICTQGPVLSLDDLAW
jgi:hypothetical protein